MKADAVTHLPGRRVEISYGLQGSGPPLLLLHGYPQTKRVWDKVAARLAEGFTVVTADLRGYGESSKPAGLPDHSTYSKRAMAQDQVELMRLLGFEHFAVAGHDRGGRVVHRMCLDHSDTVTMAVVLDILPTTEVYESVDRELATAYFHWFFLEQANDLAERLIDSNPDAWIDHVLGLTGGAGSIVLKDVEHYRSIFRDPATVHATCEDYRAAATIDLDHDRADRGNLVACPLLVLWGERGLLAQREDPLAVWRRHAKDVRGSQLPGGHFVVDDCPEAVADQLANFLSGSPDTISPLTPPADVGF
ncbi:hydrolase [Nocardioides sp. LS1]|nr:hydrolase [Nocardioides sp. LS1]